MKHVSFNAAMPQNAEESTRRWTCATGCKVSMWTSEERGQCLFAQGCRGRSESHSIDQCRILKRPAVDLRRQRVQVRGQRRQEAPPRGCARFREIVKTSTCNLQCAGFHIVGSALRWISSKILREKGGRHTNVWLRICRESTHVPRLPEAVLNCLESWFAHQCEGRLKRLSPWIPSEWMRNARELMLGAGIVVLHHGRFTSRGRLASSAPNPILDDSWGNGWRVRSMYSTTLYQNSGYCVQDSSLYANKFLVSSSTATKCGDSTYPSGCLLMAAQNTGPPAGRKFGLAVLIYKSSTSTPVVSRLLILQFYESMTKYILVTFFTCVVLS